MTQRNHHLPNCFANAVNASRLAYHVEQMLPVIHVCMSKHNDYEFMMHHLILALCSFSSEKAIALPGLHQLPDHLLNAHCITSRLVYLQTAYRVRTGGCFL